MFFDILGWIGMILILLDYGLLSSNRIIQGRLYQFINLIGALCMAIGLLPKNAWFSFTLQIIWGMIAIVAIIKIMKEERINNK